MAIRYIAPLADEVSFIRRGYINARACRLRGEIASAAHNEDLIEQAFTRIEANYGHDARVQAEDDTCEIAHRVT